jgi:hypothetical protein
MAKSTKRTRRLWDRTQELIQLKNIHSDADTAIWLPKERVLLSAAVAAVKRFGFLRPFVTIDNIKSDLQKLKALAEGKSVEEIKNNPGLSEFKNWTGGKTRLDTNIEAAYRGLKK